MNPSQTSEQSKGALQDQTKQIEGLKKQLAEAQKSERDFGVSPLKYSLVSLAAVV